MPRNATSMKRHEYQPMRVALRRAVFCAPVVVVALAAGCAGIGRQTMPVAAPPFPPGQPFAEVEVFGQRVETPDPEVQDSLAAVEDFLARTRGYQRWAVPTALGTTAPTSNPQRFGNPVPARNPQRFGNPMPASNPQRFGNPMLTGNPERATTPLLNDNTTFTRAGSAWVSEGLHPAQRSPNPFSTREQHWDSTVTVARDEVAPTFTAPPRPRLAIPALQSVSIRWSKPTQIEDQPPPRSNNTNLGLNTEPAEETVLLGHVLGQMEEQVGTQQDFDSEWKLRLAQLSTGRVNDARQISKHLPEQSQRMLGALVETAVSVRNLGRDPMLTGEGALVQVADLRTVLAERADPVVSAVAFCRRVDTFGVYEVMAPGEFLAGQSVEAIVYAEVANLSSQLTTDNVYETQLSTRLEVLTIGGESVWQHEESEIIDTCKRRRTDFFVAQRILLPSRLSEGRHILKVTVVDLLANKRTQALHPFRVISP